MKQVEFFGTGSLSNVQKIVEQLKVKNIFLIAGKTSFIESGAKVKLDQLLKDKIVTVFSNFSPNPKIEEIERGLSIFEKKNYDIIITVGGGSSIDVGKAIKLFHFKKNKKLIPQIAIPTTSGSGSESTYFIVYYKDKEKQSEGTPDTTLPEYSICDPDLTLNLPKPIAASSGIDALGQAIESYWSIYSTDQSKEFAAHAIKLLQTHLKKSIQEQNQHSKEQVMLAAHLAGKAINITKTTACHAIAYPLTSHYNIPHGNAVGLTLGEMLLYNSNVTEESCLDKRGVSYVKKTIQELVQLLDSKTTVEAKNKMISLMTAINLPTKLSQFNVPSKHIEKLTTLSFNPARINNNPRRITKETMIAILKHIY